MWTKVIVLGVAGVLAAAVFATASASGDGGPFGILGDGPDERRSEYAKDLANELGIDKDRVENAIENVERQRREAFEDEHAKALAGKLDVSVEDAERALEEAHKGFRKELRDGLKTPPTPGEKHVFRADIAKEIADALDKDVDEVREALRDIAREKLESKLDEAVKQGRLSEEQADRIRERIESGKFGPPGPMLEKHGGPGMPPGPALDEHGAGPEVAPVPVPPPTA
jgi:hypothetical protein